MDSELQRGVGTHPTPSYTFSVSITLIPFYFKLFLIFQRSMLPVPEHPCGGAPDLGGRIFLTLVNELHLYIQYTSKSWIHC